MSTAAAVQEMPKLKRKKVGRLTMINWFWGYFFITPVVVGVLVFSLGPMLFSLYMSVTNWDGITAARFIGLDNFRRMVNDARILRELANTAYYAFWTVPLGICISVIIAAILNSKIRGKTFYRVAFFLPVVTMSAAVATVWRFLFNSEFGVVNYLFRPFGLNPQWLGDPNYIMTALIVVAVWSGLGFRIVILTAGLQGISPNYYEAAEIDGASAFHKFINITVPLLTPTIFFLLVTGLMGAFRAFDLIFMFISNAQTEGPTTEAIRTMAFGIYQQGFIFMRMGYASAQALLLFAIIMAVTLVQMWLQKKFVFYE